MTTDSNYRTAVLQRVLNREIKQGEASRLLGLSDRQVRRLVRSVKISAPHAASPQRPAPDAPATEPAHAAATTGDIAVSGVSLRLAGCDTVTGFWRQLAAGAAPATGERQPSQREALTPESGLDWDFFGLSRRQAEALWPHARLLLEAVWHCAEAAAVRPSVLQRAVTALYVEAASAAARVDGLYLNRLSESISAVLGLRGICQTTDAAGGGFFGNLQQACNALVTDAAELAMVGCVDVPDETPTGAGSGPEAAATRRGAGAGAVLLQPLDRAMRERSPVLGIIRGCAAGSLWRPLRSPAAGVDAQREIIAAAYESAGITPRSVGYVEGAGFGVPADPVEFEALRRVFKDFSGAASRCVLGSVESNFGHLGTAAGIAGLAKILWLFEHPGPTEEPESPPAATYPCGGDVEFVAETAAGVVWPTAPAVPRRAALHGVRGGVGAHVVLEAFREPTTGSSGKGGGTADSLFLLSGRTKRGLAALLDEWRAFVRSDQFDTIELKQVCQSLMTGREQYRYRFGVRVTGKQALVRKLDATAAADPGVVHDAGFVADRATVFRIGRLAQISLKRVKRLCSTDALFRRSFSDCRTALKSIRSESPQLQPADASAAAFQRDRVLLEFSILYSLTKRFIDLGVIPDLVCGQRTGYVVALCVSGIVELKDAFRLLLRSSAVAGEVAESAPDTAVGNVAPVAPLRPQFPFFDNFAGEVLLPRPLNKDVVAPLRRPPAAVVRAVRRYRVFALALLARERAFRDELDQWEPVLRRCGIELYEALRDSSAPPNRPNAETRKRAALLLLTILSALRTLGFDYDCAGAETDVDALMRDLVELVNHGVIARHEIVDAVAADATGLADLLARIQLRLNVRHDLQSLSPAAVTTAAPAGPDLSSACLDRACAGCVASESHRRTVLFDIGTCGDRRDGTVVIDCDRPRALVEATLRTWELGYELSWEAAIGKTAARRVALPPYPFQRRKVQTKELSTMVRPLVQAPGTDAGRQFDFRIRTADGVYTMSGDLEDLQFEETTGETRNDEA